MDKVIVGFSTPKKWNILSGAIRKLEKTNFSHCYIKFYSQTYDSWMIYHASHAMIYFISEERFLEKNYAIEEYELTLPQDTKVKLIKNAIKRAGIPYGYRQLIGMLKVRLFYLWFKKKIKNPFSDGEKTQVCSDLLYYQLKDALDFQDFLPEYDGLNKMRQIISTVGTKI